MASPPRAPAGKGILLGESRSPAAHPETLTPAREKGIQVAPPALKLETAPTTPSRRDEERAPVIVGASIRPVPPAPPGQAGPSGSSETPEIGHRAAPLTLPQHVGAVESTEAPKSSATRPVDTAKAKAADARRSPVLAYRPELGAKAAPGARQSHVIVSAQATRTQLADRSVTLNLKTDQDVPDARVTLRPAQPGARETFVWQGTLRNAASNTANIRVVPSEAATAESPQQLVLSGSQLDPQTFYLFSPSAEPGETSVLDMFREGRKVRRLSGVEPSTWNSVLQTMASQQNIYVLAPAGFPVGRPAGVGPGLSNKSVGDALNRIGYELRPQQGALTIEAVSPAPPPSPTARAKSRDRVRRGRG